MAAELTLPSPDAMGIYRYGDGSTIAPERDIGRWAAWWPDGSPLTDDDGTTSRFGSPGAAADALARGGAAADGPPETCDHCGGRRDRPGIYGCSVGGHVEPDLAQRVVAAIERDMDDRRGMGLGSFDDDIRVEIRDKWAELVRKELLR